MRERRRERLGRQSGFPARMRAEAAKKIVTFAFLILVTAGLVLSGGGNVLYAAQEGNIYDDAELFTESEIAGLNEEIAALAEKSGWNIYAITTADAQGKTAAEYADDFFDAYSPEQEDGVALLIDMDNREITISTGGIAIRYLTDNRIDNILDDAYEEITNGYYGDCMFAMLRGVDEYYRKGIPGGQYNYDTETGKISVYRALEPFEILAALALAAGCGILIYASVAGKYRMRFGTYKYEFRENSDIRLRVKEDRFINQTVTHRRIPKQTTSSSGGSSSRRSSTHRSSSGRSHGGGSRKF